MHSFELKLTDTYYPYARWHMLPLESIAFTSGFWADWQRINRQVTLLHGYQMLEKAGNLDNLRIAAGRIDSQYKGLAFLDSDVYKWLEGIAYEIHANPNAELQALADEVIDLIADAQAEDGYLNTYYQIVKPDGRWSDLDFGHELYCAGHLFQAAVAYYQATHTTKLLDVATRFADLLAATFGPDKRQGTAGHPEIEMALVDLYRTTGKRDYLDLAKFFIDQRGKNTMRGVGWLKAEYHQDRVPVREEDRIEGHAVRAMYLNAGVTDLYLETGETALLSSLDRQWEDMTVGKLFLTGGLGSRYEGEAFGDAYELPADQCYCETCAAIGSVMWNWRMLRVTGDSRYADLMERTLYNGVLSGMGLDGKHFFYMNPLMSRGGYERGEWQTCACCPPNLMRLLASLPQYSATVDDSGIQVHLYNSGTIEAGPVRLAVQTDYPWQGEIALSVEAAPDDAWQLRLRVPEWCSSASVSINGEPVSAPTLDAGYIVLDRVWKVGDSVVLSLPMEAQLIEAHPYVDAVRDSLAIQRGPVVYCFEAADHPGVNLMDVRLDDTAALHPAWRSSDWSPKGLMVIETEGQLAGADAWNKRLYRPARSAAASEPQTRVPLVAIPYFAWANRGENVMRVWIPRA
ncbi:MAG TPA: glycoside hydrolase family 127 protein [Aggregatilinea sp.]|uniref:glycoside hydrolase family 127 protein n=1 Tax=Aggregatilinea sp. TaxID=2806333 RepID=UPI002C0D9F9B|nr:beta-L-arabinofuranosidase domain-containing protein [Aggregatilinea sp.]HML22277.1 glycoside hydrolase family 127 protein [Aggregatilinea sp.]